MAILQNANAITPAAEGYTIDQSLRFNADDSPSLTWTPGSESNRKTFTLALWVKTCDPDVDEQNYIINTPITTAAGSAEERGFCLRFGDSGNGINTLELVNDNRYFAHTPGVYRDPAAWYHIVIAFDMTAAAAADRMLWYINGEDITSTLLSNKVLDETIPQNTDIALGYTHEIAIGKQLFTSTAYNFNGYLADFYYIDGQKLAASSFGETDSTTNQWKPIEYSGTYGTNGFYQKYAGTQDGFTKCLMHMDGADDGTTFTDSSTVGSTISVSGNAHTDTTVKKFGTASAEFDGTGDYLTIPANSAFAFTAGNTQTSADQGTIEAWVYF
ncbi:MAG: hypothetical protein QF704_13395, partial [Anaerolineales bacterium]|nr:hypothetical protein [Anaerolineales bacterium]